MIVTGPFMIPDLAIFRSDKTHGNYYVTFDGQTIKDLNEKFMSEGRTLSFNYQHQKDSLVSDLVLIENWIVGENDNKAKELGFDVPVGTWMGSVKINNVEFWNNEIKTGKVKGFSIEGYLDMDIKNQINIKMITLKTDTGLEFTSEADELMVGIDLFTTNEAGEQVPAADGEYNLDNGTTITVAEGKVATIDETAPALDNEEIAAMSKLFAKILEPLQNEIAELKLKLESKPATDSATVSTPQKEVKLSATETAVAKFNKLKNAVNDLKNKK